jgi:hypothetical protein
MEDENMIIILSTIREVSLIGRELMIIIHNLSFERKKKPNQSIQRHLLVLYNGT